MDLRHIELEVLAIHGSINLRPTIDKARRLGELLTEAKEHLPHGHYLSWLARVGVNRKTADVYVLVARAPNVSSARHLGIWELADTLRRGKSQLRKDQAAELASGATDPKLRQGIVCGDSLKWLRKQPSGSVPFFVTDPPYGFGFDFDGWKDSDNAADYWNWLQPFWEEMVRVVQPGGNVLLWQGYKYLSHLMTWFPGCQIIAVCFVIRSMRQWEPIVRWTKPGAIPFTAGRYCNDWLLGDQDKVRHNPYTAAHPCAKPIHDCREIVRRYTLPGTLVVDPFCGVGGIPVACKLEGRKWLGIEQSEQYATLARQRLAGTKDATED